MLGAIQPANEAQVRPLTKLSTDLQKQAWGKIIKLAGDGKVTARLVKKAADEIDPPEPTAALPKKADIPSEPTEDEEAPTSFDVDLGRELVMLYTRKKRGGNLTPRSIPMTRRLYEVLSRRYERRDRSKPWVFWHRYWDRKGKAWVEGPYAKRYNLLRRLCRDAGVRPFGFHALRHAGASLLDCENVPLGTIQRILGHENRTTTEIYLHSFGQPEREAMERFERASRHVENESHTDSHTGHQPKSHTGKKRVAGLRLVKG